MSDIVQLSGDIKIFVDVFNIEFEKKLKQLTDLQINIKNIYEDAIKLTQPRYSSWPKDSNVKTIGDLFKYSFPDINKSEMIKPYNSVAEYNEWLDDISGKTHPEEPKIGIFFQKLRSCINIHNQLSNYNNIKKVGITNPILYSPGFYYFDVFMNYILISGIDNIVGEDKFTKISEFDPSGEVLRDDKDNKADYYLFKNILLEINEYMIKATGVDIGVEDDINTTEYLTLKSKYKSGLLSDLITDSYFNQERGYISGNNFDGYYEHILLYKAFIQAGDNYKTTLLPKYESVVEDDIIDKDSITNITPPHTPQQISNIYVFNVINPNTFILVNGTQSLELSLITDQYYQNVNTIDYWDELSEEYVESEFMGEEEILNLNNTADMYDVLLKNTINNLEDNNFNIEDSYIDYSSVEYKGDIWKSFKINDVVDQIKLTNYRPNNRFLSDLKKILYYIKNDEQIDDMRKAAYLLATSYVESSYSLSRWEADYVCWGQGISYLDKQGKQPCEKAINYYKSTKGKKNYYTLGLDNNNQCYFGRGLIQLTGKYNYEKYGNKIGVDLVGNGDLAMIPINSYKISITYMKAAGTFTKVLNGDLRAARKSVNGGYKHINIVNNAYNTWMSIFANYNKQ